MAKVHYYEVLIADSRYHSDKPLTYASDDKLPRYGVVSVPLRGRSVNGFVLRSVSKPSFKTAPVKSLLSQVPLPAHAIKLAEWLTHYYHCSLSEALRQFAPSTPTVRRPLADFSLLPQEAALPLDFKSPLTRDQSRALAKIKQIKARTILLHGDTGTGKTRVYLELAQAVLAKGRSVILLTPEIALTTQLAASAAQLDKPVIVVHSQLSAAERKQLWLKILESVEPLVIVGPRSALFSPVQKLGLIVLDEAHEPAYKQEQVPRYHTSRVASQLALLTRSKAVAGTATPTIADYYIASSHKAVVEMHQIALAELAGPVSTKIVDIKNRGLFTKNPYLSNPLLGAIGQALESGQQALVYLNRRGSARLIVCNSCGWQLLCPNCDLPLVYHGDSHNARCHTCGFRTELPPNCPNCGAIDIIYRSAGTKAIALSLGKIFPQARVARFDSDNLADESLNSLYQELREGQIDILVGTQLLAKGLDLPRLAMVGVVVAETALFLPDYTAEERTFQLLYQVIGRVGRGHIPGQVVVQSYHPEANVIQAATGKNWLKFYHSTLGERQQFRFPPFSYLLKLTCRRLTPKGAQTAAERLKKELLQASLPVEVIGPTPSFHGRSGRYYYWQLVVKSKDRSDLLNLADLVPSGWTIDLDPPNLL